MANDPYAEFTSDLGPSSTADPYAEFTNDLPSVKPPSGIMQSISDVQNRPELQPIKSLVPDIPKGTPVQQVLGSMKELASAPLRMGATINEAPNIAGEGIAVAGNEMGYPKTGATLGTAVSMAPLAIGLGEGGQAVDQILRSSENPNIIRAVANTPKMLSPEYDQLYKEAGISNNLPETGGRTARFPNLAGQPSQVPPPFAPALAPSTYPRDPNALINFARSRMEGLGDQLSPQELKDYKTLVGQLIDTGKVGGGQPLASAAQVRSMASDLLNNRIAGLEDLNKTYALSTKLRDPMQFLPDAVQQGVKKYGPWFARGLAFLGAGEALRKK